MMRTNFKISPPHPWGMVRVGGCLFLLCLLLAGCIQLERQSPKKNFFSIEATRPGTPAAEPLFDELRLEELNVAPAYAGKAFVYRTGTLQYEEDYYNRFFAAPAELLSAATARWLRASGLFAAVYDRPAPVEPAWHLSASVAAMYGDFSKRPAAAVLEISFQLLDDRQTDNRIVLHRTYRHETPLDGKAPADLAAGWSAALAQILGDLERDLQKLPDQH